MRVTPFEPWHVDLLIAQGVQPAQRAEVSLVPGSYASLPRPPGPALTAWDDAERVIIVGGIVSRTPMHGEFWGLVSDRAGPHMLAITRGLRRFLAMQPYQRIEATVVEGFGPGCRWLNLLGFEYEGPARRYGPQGETHHRYART